MPTFWNSCVARGNTILSQRRRSFGSFLLTLALFLCCSLSLSSAIRAQALNAAPLGFTLVWRKSIQGLTAFSLSPQGQRVAIITDSGKLACWAGEDARRLWSVPTQRARNVVIGDGPGTVLTYDALNPLYRKVTAYDAAKGQVLWAHTPDGAVWDAAVTRDGSHACIGTGNKSVYIYTLGKSLATTHVTLPGICESVAFASDSRWLAVGLWDESGVRCLDLAGNTLWNLPGPSNRRYDVWGAGNRYLLARSRSNAENADPTVYVLHAKDGKIIWSYPLGADSRDAVPATSDLVSHVNVSYSQAIIRASNATREQRLTSIDRAGEMVWEKGGLFFAPSLMCLTPDGEGMIVYDGQRTLYRLDEDGRVAAHSQLADTLRGWAATADHTLLLVYTHDGQLTMYKIG